MNMKSATHSTLDFNDCWAGPDCLGMDLSPEKYAAALFATRRSYHKRINSHNALVETKLDCRNLKILSPTLQILVYTVSCLFFGEST